MQGIKKYSDMSIETLPNKQLFIKGDKGMKRYIVSALALSAMMVSGSVLEARRGPKTTEGTEMTAREHAGAQTHYNGLAQKIQQQAAALASMYKDEIRRCRELAKLHGQMVKDVSRREVARAKREQAAAKTALQ